MSNEKPLDGEKYLEDCINKLFKETIPKIDDIGVKDFTIDMITRNYRRYLRRRDHEAALNEAFADLRFISSFTAAEICNVRKVIDDTSRHK